MPPLISLDDNELIRLVVQHDRDAFITLYDRHSAKVFGLTLRMLDEHMAAEEVTQDTFLKLWTRADTFSSKNL